MPASALPRSPLLVLAALVPLLAMTGCQGRGEEKELRGTAEGIYRQAHDDLRSSNYQGAIQKLEFLEARFPFSDPAKQGHLDLMYAYYKNREAESAIDQADQFIRENPTHPRVDYAYYIKGLVYFEGGASYFERLFRVDIAKRPPQEATKSFQSFQTLVQQYPKSPYAADARQRMVYLRNRLADYEVAVARYYMKRGAYVGAANRAREVLETYDGSPAVLDALAIMSNAYRKLGLQDLARSANDVRAANLNLPDVVGPSTATAGVAMAQEGAEAGPAPGMGAAAALRGGSWEGRLGLTSTNSTSMDFKGGTTADIDSSTGFALGLAYHYSDHLQLGGTLTYDQKDYTASIANGDETEEPLAVKGSLDTLSLMVDAAYNLWSRPLTPFVAAAVGWNWVDTNIATELPDVGCWWDPWYGYICTSWQDTKTLNGFAYELGLGLRYDWSDALVVDGSYRMRWVDFENATGTPSFDGIQLNLGWKF